MRHCWIVLAVWTMPSLAAEIEMRTERDIPYASPEDSARRLDVHWNPQAERLPVVVWIHGGGWRQGDKSSVQQKPRLFVDAGFVFVSVNYRMLPQVDVGDMVSDLATATRWVRDHIGRYGGTPETVFVLGHSAGAHLAALLCTDDRYLAAEGLSLDAIDGCVPIDTAAYDIPRQIASVLPRRRQSYVEVFGSDRESQRVHSPIAHLSAEKEHPRFLILHVADRRDSRSQSESMASALRKAGVDATVVAARGKTHATINRDLGRPGDASTAAILKFLALRQSQD